MTHDLLEQGAVEQGFDGRWQVRRHDDVAVIAP
jgi:hypothetical protein